MLMTSSALAQLKPTSQLVVAKSDAAVQRDIDFIVAIVNSEPITRNDVRVRQLRLVAQLREQGAALPSSAELFSRALSRLIDERAALHLAESTGIFVSDEQVQEALLSVAQQNQLASAAELQKKYEAEGGDWLGYRKEIQQELTMMRLRERDVDSRVRVTESEIDAALQDQKHTASKKDEKINLGQVLFALPDNPTAEQTAQAQAQANELLVKLRLGEDFASAVARYSQAADKDKGGVMGLRTLDRYPPLFVDAVRDVKIGGYTEPLQSNAGFHILKLLERQSNVVLIEQHSRVRHILLPISSSLSEVQARGQLKALKNRIEANQISFASAAKEFSSDSSAAQGGDLGWAGPGLFVPEFEKVMASLPLNRLSEPFTSRFGVHLVEVIERREVVLSEAQIRARIRAILKDKKGAEAYELWLVELRNRAFVEYRNTAASN